MERYPSTVKKGSVEMKEYAVKAVLSLLILLAHAPPSIYSQPERRVDMTLVRNAPLIGAYCLDGSLPAYHWDRGFGAGARNWLLQFEGGGWCNDVKSCLERASTRRGSTRYMNRVEVFSGILSNNPSLNPEFYNWNRVKLRYCDGASFAGDSKFDNGTSLLYFRGQRIWQALMLDLLPKGLGQAYKALLSGCSAGGLATFHHCDNFKSYLPRNASVKCLSDAGFFLDARDITMNHSMSYFFKSMVSLQGVAQNLNKNCTSFLVPELCFFPQYSLPYIKTPLFILNTAYDVYQVCDGNCPTSRNIEVIMANLRRVEFHHILVPPAADPNGHWYHCKLNPADCNAIQIQTLQGFRRYMLQTLEPFFVNSTRGGMFINSCFAHCQSESQDTWLAPNSPRVHNKTISQAIGDWYFGRSITKEIDCPYPCDHTCHNLIGNQAMQV